jgi:uncharacterized protein YkwD
VPRGGPIAQAIEQARVDVPPWLGYDTRQAAGLDPGTPDSVQPSRSGDHMRLPLLALLGPLALAACETPIVSTATNVGLAAATVASPIVAPVTAPVLAARMSAPADTPAPPAPAPGPSAPPIPVAVTDAGLFSLINRYRASEGKPSLEAEPSLNAAALAHAFDMQQNGFVSHAGSDGSTVGTRTRASGCNWSTVSQVITVGQTEPAAALFTWIESESQRRILLGNYNGFGEARVGNIWVAVFTLGC